MTIRCPRCGTLYRRPASARRGDVTFRCARCRHVFELAAREPAVEVDDAAEDEPDLTFDEEETDADGEPDEEEAPDDVEEAAEPAREGRRMTTPARFALRSLLGVTLAYAVLSVYLFTHPDVAPRLLGRIPLLGSALVETRLSPGSIQLANVRGEYRRVKGDRLVFVIAGTAINNAPLAVRSIQIEGRIEGPREERQVVFCGAAPHDVDELSLREIELLQTLEPPKDWTLGPGEQADFLVAFASPPADLTHFDARVLAVQAPSRRSGGVAPPARDARTTDRPSG